MVLRIRQTVTFQECTLDENRRTNKLVVTKKGNHDIFFRFLMFMFMNRFILLEHSFPVSLGYFCWLQSQTEYFNSRESWSTAVAWWLICVTSTHTLLKVQLIRRTTKCGLLWYFVTVSWTCLYLFRKWTRLDFCFRMDMWASCEIHVRPAACHTVSKAGLLSTDFNKQASFLCLQAFLLSHFLRTPSQLEMCSIFHLGTCWILSVSLGIAICLGGTDRITAVRELLVLFIRVFVLLWLRGSPKLDFKPGYSKRIYKHMWCGDRSVWKSSLLQ